MTATQRRRQLEDLVRRAEQHLAANPGWYQAKLALLAILGYVVLFSMAISLFGMGAALLWAATKGHAWWILIKGKLLFSFFIVAYVIARALWVRLEDPTGYQLTRDHFPQLFAEVDRLRTSLRTPGIHRILLTNELNAAIVQTPRLGVLGWYRNTLILGLPLLLVLSPEQARAVIGHELGHLSGNHSRFRGWIYRVRIAWYRVMDAFDQADHWGGKILAKFFDWYAPYFHAYSFALARANEYEADAISAKLTSPRISASALVSLDVRQVVIDKEYWAPLVDRAKETPSPPPHPVTGLAQFIQHQVIDNARWQEIVGKAVAVETGCADTHPALRDRLAALKATPPDPAAPKITAAQKWLGKQVDTILHEFDAQWIEGNREAWKQRCEQVRESRQRLSELRRQPPEHLSQEDLWSLASLAEQYEESTDPLPLYRIYQQTYPDDLAADLAIGRILVQREDEAGLQHLNRATKQFELNLLACELACGYALRRGDKALAEQWRLRGERQLDQEAVARQERSSMMANDPLIPSTLCNEALQALRLQLQSVSKVKHAWIAQKQVTHLPSQPVYVLTVTTKGVLWNEEKLMNILTNDLTYAGTTFVVIKTRASRKLAGRVIAIGTQVL
ncbi:MAG: M48 family metallopeptidase [Nitrospira sp.]|nr:M48 family metallopeptidase [Nitrospira sp.]